MHQLLGDLKARLRGERETSADKEKPPAKFHKKDFHNRNFYLTSNPHKVNPHYAARDKHYDENKILHDIRVMPISFHSNNTFSAVGSGKVLRGRYGITGNHRDRLWFQVSLFGAGRNAPGSVYSEGRLLSHDDRRGYVGRIQEYERSRDDSNRSMIFVEGEFYYGSELNRVHKPNSMGTFTLQELEPEGEHEEFDPKSGSDGSG